MGEGATWKTGFCLALIQALLRKSTRLEVSENKGTVLRHSLPIDHSPAQWIMQGVGVGGGKKRFLTSPWRESWNIHPAFYLFCGLPEDWYLSPASEHWWDMLYSRSLDAWGLLNNTRELGSTLLLQSTCRTADREKLIQLHTSPSREGEKSMCPKTLTENWKRKKNCKTRTLQPAKLCFPNGG